MQNEYEYQHVLAWVNHVRQEYNIGEPLDALPLGARSRCHECPVAVALGGYPGVSIFKTRTHLESIDKCLWNPSHVEKFIEDFDAGWIPDLDVNA